MPTEHRIRKVNKVAHDRQEGILVLEDIHDPHNAAAVFRSCDAFGLQKVYLIFVESEPFDPTLIGRDSSSSANKWLDFTIFDSTEACIDQLHLDGFEVVATALHPTAKSIYETNLSNPRLALMLGNEHRGLTQKAIELADHKLIIPMQGMVQSLNLSVTGAICLYEMARQRQVAGIENYYLSPASQAALALDFLER